MTDQSSRPSTNAMLSHHRRVHSAAAYQHEGKVADLKRRIPLLKRLIADCNHLAADLDQEVRKRGASIQSGRSRNAARASHCYDRNCLR